MKILQKLLLTVFIILSSYSFASEVTFSSKGKRAVFIELFTSQGCSSCPPAEKYINKLINNNHLWSKYIPLVFHVDYWDYIGWKDIFAQPYFAVRQRRYANLRHLRTVYTPAFVVNGVAWRRGFFNSEPQVAGLDSGVLIVTINDRKVHAEFKKPLLLSAGLNLNVAILGTGLTVKISAGENEGRIAKHNFVVLGYSQQLSKNNKLKNMQWDLRLPVIKQFDSHRYAFVAWVSQPDNPAPLQAVGGWINP